MIFSIPFLSPFFAVHDTLCRRSSLYAQAYPPSLWHTHGANVIEGGIEIMEQSTWEASRPLYRNMLERTGGELYIGVVGPVRTGKSTLIARFMEQMVLPYLAPGARKDRLTDELPQSGSGRMIMTCQPCFIPGEGAADIQLTDGMKARVRMVDSVGFLVPGAQGAEEGEEARMVSTPWAEEDMPFAEAAALGTRKVMEDHANVGLVVTCDGTVADLPRSAYTQAEEEAIRQLKQTGKPFSVVLNSTHPKDSDTIALQKALEKKYDVPVTLLNVKEMTEIDMQALLSSLLTAFPLKEVRFTLPDWVNALPRDHWLPTAAVNAVKKLSGVLKTVRDKALTAGAFQGSELLELPVGEQVDLGEGAIRYTLPVKEGLFSRILSEQCGETITGDAHLLSLMTELVQAKRAYDRIAGALKAVQQTGYGLVTPDMGEINLHQPELMRQGSRWGIRLRANAPTLHLIRSDIETEVSPILGTQEQSEAFIETLNQQYENDREALWNTNFFGKSLQTLVQEGLSGKLHRMPADAQEKVQTALTRMLNEGEGGMICILL